MSIFIYEAYSHDGVIVRGEYEGLSRDEVSSHLLKKDLVPVSIDILPERGSMADIFRRGVLTMTFFEKIGGSDILFLVRNLATTIKAGLSLVEAIDILILDAEKIALKNMLREVLAMVKSGQQLSKGFERHAHVFPPVFIGMLKAGEMSGQLDKTLVELGGYLSKEYSLRTRVRSALVYPVILLVASIGVVTLLLVFVLPRLTTAFMASGVELPVVTKFFLAVSKALTANFFLDTIALLFTIWFFAYFRTTKPGKIFFFAIVSRLPIAKPIVKKVALVRFARTLGHLIGSGLSIVEALELTAQSVGNHSYTKALESVIIDIKNGLSLSTSLGRYPNLFPRMLTSLVVVGERTGTLREVLTTFADFYEEEVDNSLKNLTAIVEPTLLLIMGLLVGAIAISIILPIYRLVGHFA